jgi:hypothetical protein
LDLEQRRRQGERIRNMIVIGGKRGWGTGVAMAGLMAVMTWALVAAGPARAVVVIFDGFGDADLNNNGVALEPFDVDVNGAGDGTAGDAWEPVQDDADMDTIFADGVMVQEVTAVENATDRGVPWYHLAGFTDNGVGDAKSNVKILSDAANFLPDTNPAIGFTSGNTTPPGQKVTSAAIDDGLALAIESKGRNTQVGAFFDEDYSDGNQGRISLGQQVGDLVRVSFDFRVWMSSPNFNDQSFQHLPTKTEMRFGLYQDTDARLGMTHPTGGRNSTPVVWGEEGGLLRGDGGSPNSGAGDHGWFARVPIEDPDEPDSGITAIPPTKPLPDGAEARITEEVNQGGDDPRIMSGQQDTIATPDQTTPNFVNLSYRKVYHVALTLDRFSDPTGVTVRGTLDITDRETNQTYSLSGFDRLDEINATNDPDGGFESDSWDYFVMGISGSFDDADWLMDNFMVEVIGSNADADFGGDPIVDGSDFLTWQRNFGATGLTPPGSNSSGDANLDGRVDRQDYTIWKGQFGGLGNTATASGGAVPEPGATVMFLVGLIGGYGLAWRGRKRKMSAC